jgi:hypothetical protein
MALTATPKLSEIKTELASANSKLTDFISEAGKTGVWNKQSDFASYSKVEFNSNITRLNYTKFGSTKTIAITSSSSNWFLYIKPSWITVTPESGVIGTTNVDISADLNADVYRDGDVIFKQYTTGTELYIYVTQAAGSGA